MAGELTLFDITPYVVGTPDAEPVEKLSPDRRRTLRHADAIRRGVHPLGLLFGTSVQMHPDADRTAANTDGRNLPLRCGSCRFRIQVSGEHKGIFPKCGWRDDNPTDQRPKVTVWPRITGSGASDCRAWWPACTNYTPGDNALSDDAARFIPDLVGVTS